jgi:hypothetical protein
MFLTKETLVRQWMEDIEKFSGKSVFQLPRRIPLENCPPILRAQAGDARAGGRTAANSRR